MPLPSYPKNDAIYALLIKVSSVVSGQMQHIDHAEIEAATAQLVEYQKDAQRAEILMGIISQFPTSLDDFLQDDDQQRLFGYLED